MLLELRRDLHAPFSLAFLLTMLICVFAVQVYGGIINLYHVLLGVLPDVSNGRCRHKIAEGS